MKRYLSILPSICLFALLTVCCGPQEPPRISVTGITLDRVSATLTEGESTTLVATLTPADATDKSVRWTSTNQAVAIVTDEGVVNAIHSGTSVITATTTDGGLTATCTVTVDIAMAALTGDVSHISCRNAVITGHVNLPAKTSSDLKMGVLYSTSSGVLFGSSTAIEATALDADYRYSITTDALQPETIYYYRSYILQNNEVTYGDTKSFATLPVSSMIKTEDATEINPYDALLNASLDLTDCYYQSLKYGFTLIQPDGLESPFISTNLSGNTFSCRAESLSRENKYEVIAYVELDGEKYLGEKKEFTTETITANALLDDAQDITELKATLSGRLVVESNGVFTKTATLYYSPSATTVNDLKSIGSAVVLTLNGTDGCFSQCLSNLNPNTTYYYALEAIVDEISFTSDVKHFTTADYSAIVNTEDVSNLGYTTASLNAALSIVSIEPLNKETWFYYSETGNTVDALLTGGVKLSASLSDNGFCVEATGLKDATTYYYVACAKVLNKTVYGEVKSFTTKILPNGAVDMGLSVLWHHSNIDYINWGRDGIYYAWGETGSHSFSRPYSFSYTVVSNGFAFERMNKYCTNSGQGTVDNITILEESDDVATVTLSGKWRMPTVVEWEELLNPDNCTRRINNRDGTLIFISKKTGKQLTLLLGGYEANVVVDEGVGYYWSSSLDTSQNSNAWCACLKASGISLMSMRRNLGMYVRAVCDL